VHGVIGNPIVALAQKIGLPVERNADPFSGVRAFTADGKQLPAEEAGELAGRLLGTVFAWLPAVAQGDDGGKGVTTDNVSLYDGILMEDSPIYGGGEETMEGSSRGVFGEEEVKGEHPAGKRQDDKLRTALSLVRAFQGWVGAPLDYVSLKWWGFNQNTEGGDGILVRGYGEMVNWLRNEVERMGGIIRLEEKLTSVELVEGEEEHDDGSVLLTTRRTSEKNASSDGGRYDATYTLLTLPLGVLKHSPPKFKPPMSLRRKRAIERLGMGLLDKIVLVYDYAWWAGDSQGARINILIPSDEDPTRLLGPTGGLPPHPNIGTQPEYTQGGPKGSFPARTPAYLKEHPQALMIYDLHAQCGIPALCVFVPGEFADVMEMCGDEATREWLTGVVGQWLGGLRDANEANAAIPRPVDVLRTAWRKDENAFGSYAYIPVGRSHDGLDEQSSPGHGASGPGEPLSMRDGTAASPLDQLELSRTMWDRCFWAGEHTELNQYASVHAAWTSGVREAEKILARLNGVDI